MAGFIPYGGTPAELAVLRQPWRIPDMLGFSCPAGRVTRRLRSVAVREPDRQRVAGQIRR